MIAWHMDLGTGSGSLALLIQTACQLLRRSTTAAHTLWLLFRLGSMLLLILMLLIIFSFCQSRQSV